MKIKVKDIAAAAGVSPATVSLVLNNKPSRISEDTREHILRIANEMQLQKQNTALFTEYKRVQTIGLIIPECHNPFFQGMALAVVEAADSSGYTIMQCSLGEDIQTLYKAVESLVAKNVDGVILVPPANMNKEAIKLLKSLQASKIPMLLLDRAVYSVFCDYVTADNKQGSRLAVEYLLRQGHRRIGLLLGEESVYTSQKRLEGYMAALAGGGIPYEPGLVYHGMFDVESGRHGAKKLVCEGVTAIFAANDLMAYGVYQYARENELRIPEDLSVIGYDNTELCDLLFPPLTSMDQGIASMAAKAVELMLQQISEKGKERRAENYYFAPRLVERNSVKAL